jgi:hypothetical protein
MRSQATPRGSLTRSVGRSDRTVHWCGARRPGLVPGTGATRDRSRFDDSGSETLEIVLILPVLMALIVLGLQLAMWGLAAHALSLGIAEGGAAARAHPGSDRAAETIVAGDAHAIAGSLVGGLKIDVRSLPDNFVVVSGSGEVPSIFPGLHLRVSADSAGPVQGFRAGG